MYGEILTENYKQKFILVQQFPKEHTYTTSYSHGKAGNCLHKSIQLNSNATNEINWQQTRISFTYLYTSSQKIYSQGNLTPICYMEQSQIMHKLALIMHTHMYLLFKEN